MVKFRQMVLQTRDDDESRAEIWTEIRIYKKLRDLKLQLPIEHSHVVGPVWSDLANFATLSKRQPFCNTFLKHQILQYTLVKL